MVANGRNAGHGADGSVALQTAADFMAQAFEWLRGSYVMLAFDIGIRSGLVDVLRRIERGTPGEIAEAGGLSERHVREWLSLMATVGAVTYEPVTGVFTAAPGLLAATLPPDPPPTADFAVLAPAIADTIRNGGGVGYEAFGDGFVDRLDGSSRMTTDMFLLEAWVPAVDGLREALLNGASVAEIGCGTGHALNVLAREFPSSSYVGFDINIEALRRAEAEAREWGLANVRFERRDVVSLPDAPFNVVLAFDCIHDQAHPRQVVSEIRRALEPHGLFVMIEPRSSSRLEDNLDNPQATFLYTMSLFHCMQVSLAQGGEGLGTAWGEDRAREMLESTGFAIRSVVDVPGGLMPQTLFVATPR